MKNTPDKRLNEQGRIHAGLPKGHRGFEPFLLNPNEAGRGIMNGSGLGR
jgi:hypothetical protein